MAGKTIITTIFALLVLLMATASWAGAGAAGALDGNVSQKGCHRVGESFI
jgi:hypothetical protein